jgi:ubiquinone/menaquinone biosynthesis C-methylase UbiE
MNNILKRLIRTFATILAIFLAYQAIIRVARKLYHFPVPAFIGRFLDSDQRRSMQPPGPIIERSGFRAGMRVLEVGCGSGSYTTFVARAVGPEGEVYALDIQPQMLAQIQAKLDRPENRDITNIRLVEHSAYDLPFEDDSFDLVYMITVLQEIPDRLQALREIRRVLKPEGCLAVTEFLPDPDYVPASYTVRLCESAGFALDAQLGNVWTYTVRFLKPFPSQIPPSASSTPSPLA